MWRTTPVLTPCLTPVLWLYCPCYTTNCECSWYWCACICCRIDGRLLCACVHTQEEYVDQYVCCRSTLCLHSMYTFFLDQNANVLWFSLFSFFLFLLIANFSRFPPYPPTFRCPSTPRPLCPHFCLSFSKSVPQQQTPTPQSSPAPPLVPVASQPNPPGTPQQVRKLKTIFKQPKKKGALFRHPVFPLVSTACACTAITVHVGFHFEVVAFASRYRLPQSFHFACSHSKVFVRDPPSTSHCRELIATLSWFD